MSHESLFSVYLGIMLIQHATMLDVSMKDNEISVFLGKPISDSKGIEWTQDEHGKARDNATLDVESRVSVYFSNGKQTQFTSFLTIVDQNGGRITRIKVTPLRTSISFQEASTKVRRLVGILTDKPSQAVKDRIQSWIDKPPQWSRFARESVLVQITHENESFIEIRPAPDKDKWYVSYSFHAK
jgi:hypothetical protein